MSRPKCKFKTGDIVRNKSTNALHFYVHKHDEMGFIHLLEIPNASDRKGVYKVRPYKLIYDWEPIHNEQHEFIMNIRPVLQAMCDCVSRETYGDLDVYSD